MAPGWLTILAWTSLGLGFASAALILGDVYLLGHRHKMRIMEAVYPVTALYVPVVAVWFYLTRGRGGGHEHDDDGSVEWDHVAKADTHCGAGCTLGDLAGGWLVFLLGLEIAGKTLWPEYIFDFTFAFLLGIVFQYFAIVPMRNVGRREGVKLALRADTLSIVASEVGLFGWMALSALVFFEPPLHLDSAEHWFMMQIGMVLGFLTSYPVNVFLLRRGWKEKM